jgi:Golgi phosphoprotein 3
MAGVRQRRDLDTLDQLVLLALHDEKGTLRSREALRFALAGAAFLELVRLERIGPSGKHLVLRSSSPTGDPLLDEVLAVMKATRRPKDIKGWIKRLPGKVKRIDRRVIERLVLRGILTQTEAKVLWVFPVSRYPERDPGPERKLRERLRRIVLQGSQPTSQEVELLGLVEACKLTGQLFARGERREARKRLKKIVRESRFGKEVSAIQREIAAATAAVMIATT